MRHLKPICFPTLFLFIAAVSLYDVWLTIIYAEFMYLLEENPVGRWLIRANDGDVSALVFLKICGTMAVLLVLRKMQRAQSPRALPVTGGVATFQGGLLMYLSFA